MDINDLSTLFDEGPQDKASQLKPKGFTQNQISWQLKFFELISTVRAQIRIPS